MITVILTIVFTLVDIAFLALEGVVLKQIWNWFIPEAFNLPYINMKVGCAIAIILALTTYRRSSVGPESTDAGDIFAYMVEGYVGKFIVISAMIGFAAVAKFWF